MNPSGMFFANARVFDGTGRAPFGGEVLVKDNRLEAGFTSAYSAGSLGPRFEIALREEIDGGWTPGPRLRASSLERLPDGALGLKADDSHARSPDTLRGYVREMAKSGVDSIKFLL